VGFSNWAARYGESAIPPLMGHPGLLIQDYVAGIPIWYIPNTGQPSYKVEVFYDGEGKCYFHSGWLSWYFKDSSHRDGLTEGLVGEQRRVRLEIG
jgi:hypothetical protein